MKLKNTMTVAAFLLLGTAVAAKDYKPGTYQIDPTHSKIGFEVQHLVISTVEGKFNDAKGSIVLDKDLSKSKIDVQIPVASVDTGVSKRDEHLQSADFFDAAKYPALKFVSTSISGKPGDFKIKGNLTIKNITKPVTLEAKYLGTVKDGYGNEKVAFEAETEISRKEFGLTWNNMVEAGPVVGDKVELDLKVQAALSK